MSEDERDRRIREAHVTAMAEQVVPPDTVFYLSFADNGWLGGCYVLASDLGSAVGAAHIHGCNPGGEVAGMGPIPAEMVKSEYLNRLLHTKDELEDAAVTDP